MKQSATFSSSTLGGYLLERLHGLGLRHVFGIPGDYVLSLYKMIEESPLIQVGTTREDCAGFAADAYARLNGIGAACVTYCVGGLNTVNAVACAYAERSPVVLLSGSPGLNERHKNPLLHHMVRDFGTQREVFEKVTVASVILDDPQTAQQKIDEALEAMMRYKRPIYLEIPRDLVYAPITLTKTSPASPLESDPEALAEAVAEVVALLSSAQRPVVLAGAEIHRFGLQEALVRLVERWNIPIASTLLGKSVIRENHPLFVGVYGGLIGRDEVNKFVDDADCRLLLGSILTDMDLAMEGPLFSEGSAIQATAERVSVKRHQYSTVNFVDFVKALADTDMPQAAQRTVPPRAEMTAAMPSDESPATLAGLFGTLDSILKENDVVIADVGESLFAAADLHVRQSAEFLSPAYYTSMGFAVPAAVGVGFAAPHLRTVVLVGDGAFQMTGTELSTCVRYGQSPIVIILNNRGYSTEREILEGPFNDIPNWNYEKVCDLVGGGIPYRVSTHGAVVEALTAAFADNSQMHVLNVELSQSDHSPAMVRLAHRLADRISRG